MTVGYMLRTLCLVLLLTEFADPSLFIAALAVSEPQTSSQQTLDAGDPPKPSGNESARAVVLIPLDGRTEVALSSPGEGVDFDIDGDGRKERVAWPQKGAEVAFLFLCRDGDEVVRSGKQLVGGNFTRDAWNGFMALRLVAGRAGGAIRPEHPLFSQFHLWVDRNHDGRSSAEELQRLAAVFQQLGLGYFPVKSIRERDAYGNVFRFEGWGQRVGVPIESASGYSPLYEVVLQVARSAKQE